jgi:hypothetical protein
MELALSGQHLDVANFLDGLDSLGMPEPKTETKAGAASEANIESKTPASTETKARPKSQVKAHQNLELKPTQMPSQISDRCS